MPDINAIERFGRVPQIDTPRSIFNINNSNTLTFDVGELVPIYCNFLYPGTTVKMITNKVVRLQTLLTPFFGNAYIDVFWFFVPMRLTWTHTKEFFGENTQSAWVDSTVYQVPSISSPTGGFDCKSIAGYMNYPKYVEWTNSDPRRPMALPLRAYALIANEFFRSENLTDPLNIPVGDTNQTGTNGASYINDVANGGRCFKVAKFFDRFSGCLPSPQKAANPVTFPLISGSKAPVAPGSTDHITSLGASDPALHWIKSGGSSSAAGDLGINSSMKTIVNETAIGGTSYFAVPTNLWADLSSSVGAVTVNELRLAFQLQRYYEAIARSGSRYIEQLSGLWHVESDDARLQRPEYLGGNRVPINISEVINQAQATNDYLGDLGAMSHTADSHYDFEYSTREHGFLIGLTCVRYDHVFAQGTDRYLSRLDREDYYIPQFANIGEQPVYQDEICATSTNMATKTIFGYQEAWSDLRFKNSTVNGEMLPGIANTLASWNLADYYSTAPTLSDSWIREDEGIVDRVLAVSHSVSNQVLADFYFQATYSEVLPMYSVPGLIDHY